MKRASKIVPALAAAGLCLLSVLLPSCGGTGSGRTVTRDIEISSGPAVLRGTIGYETTLVGHRPVLVSGYGLVVGLEGTGSTEVPEFIAATMEREIGALSGGAELGFRDTPFEGLSPRQILRHPDTAVVIVEGAIAPGSPVNSRFDVLVRSLEGTNLTSLRGGMLWTTRLQIGPPGTLGGPQTRIIAEARGEVFLNPFAEPGSGRADEGVGRVLGGGVITAPQPLELVLKVPLHSRALLIAQAVNQRFPSGPRGEGTTAFGRSDTSVQVYAPPAYEDRFDEFVNLLRATPINQGYPEQLAQRYSRALVTDPGLADELQWALRAVGQPSVAFVRDYYSFPERGPRMAALTVGAHLQDPRAADFLERIAYEESDADRLAALTLLGVADDRGSTDLVLRDIAGSEAPLSVRVAAYESLMRRAERWQAASLARRDGPGRRSSGPTPAQIRESVMRRIPPGNPQGVERLDVGGRFSLDVVQLGAPLLYVTVQGRPRVTIFGAQAELRRPMTVMAWDNRLLMRSDSPRGEILLRYEPPRGTIVQHPVGADLADFIQFLARGGNATSFGPGLGFTYAEVVAALHAISEDDGTDAAVATEDDALRARLLAATETTISERPATSGERGSERPAIAVTPQEEAPAPQADAPGEGRRTYVVPITHDDD
jgi:hypothetical protein